MANEPPPSSVVAPPLRPRPWGVPVAGGALTLALLVAAVSGAGYASQALWAAGAAFAVTAIATTLAFRFVARSPVEGLLPPSVRLPADAADASYFKTAFEALPDPVLVVTGGEPDDVAGRRVAYANAAARVFLRIPTEGALLVTALRDPEVLEGVDEALFGRVDGVTAFETRGAQDRFWRAWTRPLPADDGGQTLALVYLRDETDARRMEQMRADFLANASHELRTPLASLAGFIETLKGHARRDAAARDRFLDIMAAQADRMSRLIADLLSLSRIELNEHVPPSGEADLTLIATDVVDALAPLASSRAVKLATSFAKVGAAEVAGDRDQIVQVVQNLVDNAIKYSAAGQAVEIAIDEDLDAGQALSPHWKGAARLSLLVPDRVEAARYALIRVRDHGPGVAREHLPRLTERFYRVEGQKSGERLGTGLGLAIVKHIVNRHRGGLTIESLPGEGALFSVFLPRALPYPRAALKPAATEAAVEPSTAAGAL